MFSTFFKIREYVNSKLWNKESGSAKRMWLLTGLNILEACIKVSAPILLLEAIQQAKSYIDDESLDEAHDSESTSLLFIVAFASAVALGQILPSIRRKVTAEIQSSLSVEVVKETMELSTKKSLEFHQVTPTGTISQNIFNIFLMGSNYVPSLHHKIVPTFVEASATVGVIAGLIDARLAFCVVGSTCFFSIVAYSSAHNLYVVEDMRVEQRKQMAGTILEVLGNFENMHYFNNEKYELSRVDSAVELYKSRLDISEHQINNAEIIRHTSLAASFIAIFAFSSHLYMNKEIDQNDLLILIIYSLQLNTTLIGLSSAISQLGSAISELDKCIDFLHQGPDIEDAPGAREIKISEMPSIKFDHVTLKAEDGTKILDDVSFLAPAGKTTAVVGASGSGKTTLSKLLFRYVKPDSGDIYIDNQKITGCTVDSVRRSMGIVPQNPVLFNDTLQKNVWYGDTRLQPKNIAPISSVLEEAGLGEDLRTGRLKLNRTVGQGGSQISGGQRHPVAIARFLLKNPPIIILDEATSALDPKSKADINETLDKICFGYTTLKITHDIPTVANAGHILVFDKGKLVEQGTFHELTAIRKSMDKPKEIKQDTGKTFTGDFFRMFQSHCEQLGQDVESAIKQIPPSIIRERKRSRIQFFQPETPKNQVSIVIPKSPTSNTPLLQDHSGGDIDASDHSRSVGVRPRGSSQDLSS